MQVPLSLKPRVLVNVILDKSGSMASKLKDVIEGFNAYVDGLAQEDKVEYLFSLTLFDTQVTYRDVAIPLARVRKLDNHCYQPGGNTALNDAIGITVRKIDADRPQVDKVVTVIMTDGEENSSREWTHDAVKSLISQKENEGTWTFVFLEPPPTHGTRGAPTAFPQPAWPSTTSTTIGIRFYAPPAAPTISPPARRRGRATCLHRSQKKFWKRRDCARPPKKAKSRRGMQQIRNPQPEAVGFRSNGPIPYFATAACVRCNSRRACEIRSTTSNGFTSDEIPFPCK